MRRKDREVTDKAVLRQLLEEMQVCHLGMVDGDKPYVVPLNFGFVWENELPTIYFHAAATGKKLAVLQANPRVCLQWDGAHQLLPGSSASSCSYGYKSLIGEGVAEPVTEDAAKRLGLTAIMRQYGQPADDFPDRVVENTCVLRVTLSSLTGKVNV